MASLQKMLWERVEIHNQAGGPGARVGHTCNVVGNFLYVFGGYDANRNFTNSVFIFDTGRSFGILVSTFLCFLVKFVELSRFDIDSYIYIYIYCFGNTNFILVVFSGMALNIFLIDCYRCYFSSVSLGTSGRVAPQTFNYISMSPR